MSRFSILTNMLFFAMLLYLLSINDNTTNNLSLVSKYLSSLLILPLIFSFRVGTDFYSASLLIGNFITSIFYEDRYLLIYYLKDIF